MQVACVLTPATGREATSETARCEQAETPGRVIVVGAGPAGLRTAATAAARGHEVTVHERDALPGGHVRDMAWLPTRDRWWRAIDDLVAASSGPARVAAWAASSTQRRADRGEARRRRAGHGRRLGGGRRELAPARSRGIPGAGAGNVLGLGAALARAREDAARSAGAS